MLLPEAADRAAFVLGLTGDGVGTSVHYIPLHRMPYWKDRYTLVPETFPQAEARYLRTVSLPLYPSLTLGQVDDVCNRFLKRLGSL